ncbi:MAG TPA: lipid II flippase MurJ, partial [Micromonosporaceae bacterium]|nr:lipid II flippase MurJ [Micromonosporaceae bacterium]
VAAQQVALLVALRLGMAGPEGTVVLYNLAQTIYLLPWAVLAVPVAVAAYPVLATSAATGAADRFRATLASTTRAVLLLGCLGAAALVALAVPGARLLVALMPATGARPADLAAAIAGFAPGLIGYGLSAALTRALYARGDTAVAAGATVIGWAAVAAGSVLLASVLPTTNRALALAAANSAGMTLLGLALLVAVGRRAGAAALDGLPRAAVAGLVAAVTAGVAGWAVTGTVHATPDAGTSIAQGMLSGVVVGAVFFVVGYALDRRDVRPAVDRVRRRVARLAGRRGSAGGTA